MTALLLGLDTLLAVACAGLWLGAGVIAVTTGDSAGAARSRRTATWLAGAALAATAARILVVALLAGAGWWFVEDRLLLGLPLVVVPAVVAVAVAVPRLRHAGLAAVSESRVAALLLITGYGAAAALVDVFVLGYPVSAAGASTLVVVVAALAAQTLPIGRRWRAGVAGVAVLAVLGSVGAAWWSSRPADRLSMVDHSHHGGVSVASLRGPAGGAARQFTLTAQHARINSRDALTFDGTLPGPELRVTQGDTVEVTLRNKDIADGVTIHWHGYDVPNGEDGVAGLTQDAVPVGGAFTYRFVAKDAGTYWYHSHQRSHEQVPAGLYGSFVVTPRDPGPGLDLSVPVHTAGGTTLFGAVDGIGRRTVPAGTPVRLRLINTDDSPHRMVLQGTEFRLSALDGGDLHEPGPVSGKAIRVPAGGRADLTFPMPATPVWLTADGNNARGVALTADGATAAPPPAVGWPELDIMGYGTPAPTGMDAGHVDRAATLVLDRQVRFLDGLPRFAYTVNGSVFPRIPPIEVREGELLKLTVVNRGTDTHPMHPHGHHVLVLSRNGVRPSGSPLWLDTFDVRPGEVWEVALRADNPGLWMSHCHNLDHAANGMTLHLAYIGVSTPYTMGSATGNHPE
ncbi:MAG TPA: multicopper oxidase family protein [Micromonosporaceae bacterium]|nr:multicopper oxidase family protein [Micromonosporaceae bacterium]